MLRSSSAPVVALWRVRTAHLRTPNSTSRTHSLRSLIHTDSRGFASVYDIMDSEEIKARLAKELKEYRSLIQGRDLYDYMGHRVVESRTTSGNLVAVKKGEKGSFRQSEAEMMQYAHEKGILTPRVLGVYYVKRGVIAMVTDRVPGDSLDKVWHTLTEAEKKNVELQLKQQVSCNTSRPLVLLFVLTFPKVQEMRKHTQPYIGRIGNIKTYNFFDRLHDNDMGPFSSEEEFDDWCLTRVKFARVKFPYYQKFWKHYVPKMRNEKSSKFVLTHGDLAARNIMVKDGQLTGIVDWEYSGFFPEYMEYALATVIHESVEDWWLPVLKRVLEPSGFLRSRFIATIKKRGL